jgi:hypothetical protein
VLAGALPTATRRRFRCRWPGPRGRPRRTGSPDPTIAPGMTVRTLKRAEQASTNRRESRPAGSRPAQAGPGQDRRRRALPVGAATRCITQLDHPNWSPAWDLDPAAAHATRRCLGHALSGDQARSSSRALGPTGLPSEARVGTAGPGMARPPVLGRRPWLQTQLGRSGGCHRKTTSGQPAGPPTGHQSRRRKATRRLPRGYQRLPTATNGYQTWPREGGGLLAPAIGMGSRSDAVGAAGDSERWTRGSGESWASGSQNSQNPPVMGTAG